MKSKYFMVLNLMISALAVVLFAKPSMAYYTIFEYEPTSYVNKAEIYGSQGMLSANYGAPANASISLNSNYWTQNRRGSDMVIENNYNNDPAGVHSRLSVSMDGLSIGMINVSPGFIIGSASSFAKYALMITGGSGSLDADILINPVKDTYGNNLSQKIELANSSGQNIFSWKDGDPTGLKTISLNFNEPFYISAFSDVSIFETMGGVFNYESILTFDLDIIQTTAVPVPSTVFLFIPGLMGLFGLKKWDLLKNMTTHLQK